MDKELEGEFHKIALDLTHGTLTSTETISCPFCKQKSLEYSFTVKELPDRFGFYLVCNNCGHWLHLSLSGRPPNFREDQVVPKYQKKEDDAVKFARDFLAKGRSLGTDS